MAGKVKEYIVELKNINFSNDDYQILDDINLKIEKDTFTCIIGRSGSGKSTLLKIIAGSLEKDNGVI
jgi:ABC-type Fe3+/spermidine/putrescine transport system ATPase subunit